MVKNAWIFSCLLLVAITVGCATPPAPPAAPPDTRAADIQAVKDLDAAKWAAYFTDDGSGLYPGGPTLNGKAAIQAAMVPIVADKNFALTFASDKQVASKGGDMIYTQGTYSMTLTNPKTKKPMTDKGKFLTIYMKQADGSWKVTADTFNSDSAM
jgi:uncharacterized protein (TIGR02246 family)